MNPSGIKNAQKDPKVILMEYVKSYPALYKKDDNSVYQVTRTEKQRIWDTIARRAGYKKTEDAINKWRSLILYMKQHMEHCFNKKLRQYAPKTDNPNDKYVQLNDWPYYKYMSFMEPYIRMKLQAAQSKTQILTYKPTNDFSLREKENKVTKSLPDTSNPSLTQNTTTKPERTTTEAAKSGAVKSLIKLNVENLCLEFEIDESRNMVKCIHCTQKDKAIITKNKIWTNPEYVESVRSAESQELSAEDKNLREFFDNMLHTVQRLPAYHKSLVKMKLQQSVARQQQLLRGIKFESDVK